jgi:hypothetical protein
VDNCIDFFTCLHGEAFIKSQDIVHTAFSNSSHYFRLQNSHNNEMRWHDILMQTLTCMTVSIQIGGNLTDYTFSMVQYNLKETCVLMQTALY